MFVAPQVVRLIGRQPSELIGTPLQALVLEDDFDEAASLQRAIMERATTSTVAYRLKRATGEPVWVEAAVHAVQAGTLTAFVGSWRDITALHRRRSAEQNQRQPRPQHGRRSVAHDWTPAFLVRSRASDTLARRGGDEFTLITSNLRHVEDTVRVAQLLLQKITEPVMISTQELFVTASTASPFFRRTARRSEAFSLQPMQPRA